VLRLLFVGRFDRQKGVDIFCEVLKRLGSRAYGVMVGGAVLHDSINLEYPYNVRTVGWRPKNELASFYRSADILVVPSRWEGFGLVAAEAMSLGCPVIASNVGGLA